jgi:non-homologous end joining protein Ku
MLKAKQAGQVFAVPEAPEPSKVVNIMDALKRSLEAEGAGAADVRRPRAPSKKPAAEEVRKPAAAEGRKPKARKRAS